MRSPFLAVSRSSKTGRRRAFTEFKPKQAVLVGLRGTRELFNFHSLIPGQSNANNMIGAVSNRTRAAHLSSAVIHKRVHYDLLLGLGNDVKNNDVVNLFVWVMCGVRGEYKHSNVLATVVLEMLQNHWF